jgi:hypothetical protein
MTEIIEIHTQVVAQSESEQARKEAIAMLQELLIELRRSPEKDEIKLRKGDVSEGRLQIEVS